MVATKKLKYGTRRLVAGDEFDCREGHDRLLQHIGYATSRPSYEPVSLLESLRSKARQLGIKVDNRWGVKRLQAEIDKGQA